MSMRHKRIIACLTFVLCAIIVVAMVGCKEDKPSGSSAEKPPVAAYQSNPTGPVNSSELDPNLITAEQWKDKYPQVYESYRKNDMQSYDYPGAPKTLDYTEEYPDITYLCKGYGYSKDYTVPQGHTQSLETIRKTLRPHKTANCFSCKTPQFMILEKKYGPEFYKMDFEQISQEITEPISCYDCHENEPGVMHMNRSNLVRAMNDWNIKIDPRIQVCAQCHNDYYMDKETGAPTNPYSHGANPDGMLQHYNEHHVVDFTHPDSGVEVAQVQHPDWEAFVSSPHAAQGLVCADCHMAREDGYRSHKWTSPFESETIMNKVCLGCHTDQSVEGLEQKVNGLQDELNAKQREVSGKLVALHKKIAENKDQMDEQTLATVRSKTRDAQFYWCYFFSQNGDGFHNPKESREVLDKANKLIDEANGLF